jgi:CTP synthase (UTP-ammonia lyase)
MSNVHDHEEHEEVKFDSSCWGSYSSCDGLRRVTQEQEALRTRPTPATGSDMRSLVGIVGDFNAGNHTHQATNMGLRDAGIAFEWVPTTEIRPDQPEQRLASYKGIFIAPSSPYHSMDGALAGIRFARERGVPLVGT